MAFSEVSCTIVLLAFCHHEVPNESAGNCDATSFSVCQYARRVTCEPEISESHQVAAQVVQGRTLTPSGR